MLVSVLPVQSLPRQAWKPALPWSSHTVLPQCQLVWKYCSAAVRNFSAKHPPQLGRQGESENPGVEEMPETRFQSAERGPLAAAALLQLPRVVP